MTDDREPLEPERKVDTSDDSDSTMMTIIIIIVAVVAVILIVLIGCCIRRRIAAGRSSSKVQMLDTESARLESQAELKSMPAVNATQPNLETDEEGGGSMINMRTQAGSGKDGEKPNISAAAGMKKDSGMDMT